jgi:hypothetical protein
LFASSPLCRPKNSYRIPHVESRVASDNSEI